MAYTRNLEIRPGGYALTLRRVRSRIAAGVASNVQHMLEQMVDSINAQTLQDHPDTPQSQLLAINPMLPAICDGLNDAGQGSGWLHVVQTLEKTLEQAKEQTAQIQTSQVLRDVEGDGYLERTEWVAASDSAGNTQGALVIDFNGNALIETRDILNLGGNTAEAGNQTDEANGARQNADLQRNNVQWLDANGDGVLDAKDPAFAAVNDFDWRMWA